MSDKVLDCAFSALADPTRRAVLRALGDRPHRAGELAERVRMSAPALSRHLRVLRRARLVTEHALDSDARVRVYELAPDGLRDARSWLVEVEQFWGEQLAAFAAHAEASEQRSRRSRRSSR